MIITVTRCYNEEKNIERFLKGYDFSDLIIVSDGGSTDNSIEMLTGRDKVKLLHFPEHETINGYYWNPDNSHFNFIINAAKEYNPDWIILDDMDDVPNYLLRENARQILNSCEKAQVNAFRLYMWGDDQYFPFMNRNFNPIYKSLWAWKPAERDVRGDLSVKHGTLLGIDDSDTYGINTPMCLLHKSWHPDTIDAKVTKYNSIDLPMNHPLDFAGTPEPLPEWAHT